MTHLSRPAPQSASAASGRDETQDFLAEHRELKPGETFRFACHPGVRCFNACCSDLAMPLTPYDVLRLRRGLGMSSDDFLRTHADVTQFSDTGFPRVYLRMEDGPLKVCSFVTDKGCSVYADRSGACRSYPLGRATREDEASNLQEQFFIVEEPHCTGFTEARQWTAKEWLADQGLEPYFASNDAYMRLMSRQRRAGQPLSPQQATMCLLAFYQLDRFADFLTSTGMLQRLDMDDTMRNRILEDEEARLEFAYHWAALVLFRDNSTLRMKG